MLKLFYWMWGHEVLYVFHKGMRLYPIYCNLHKNRERWVRKSFVVRFAGNLERGAPVCWISKFRTHHETTHLSYIWVSQHSKETFVNYTLRNRSKKCLQSFTSTNAFFISHLIWSLLVHDSLIIFQDLLNVFIFGINYSC